jgi:integrase
MSRGHIRRRGANSWELKFDVERAEGHRRISYRAFKGTKREAQAELVRLLAQVADSTHVEPSKLRLGDYVHDRVEQWRAAGTITPKTAQGYRQLLENQIKPFLGTKLLQKLNSLDLERWHTTLRTDGRKNGRGGVSPRTVHHAHRLLSKALREAVRHGLVMKNVATLQQSPKVTAPAMQILSAEQVRDFPAILAGHELYAPAVTALFTGMRRGELTALRWGHVQLDRGMIRVCEALEETHEDGLRIKAPKSAAGVREVSLPDIVIETLREQRRHLLEQRLTLGLGKLTDADLVFPAWDGSPQSPDAFSAAWAKAAKELGLNVSFHGLRHTHASQLIDAGIDVVTIARRLGHSSPAITLATYAHMFRQDDGKAAAAINVALAGLMGKV